MSIENLSAIWPEWEIEKQLGRGSYGVVYKAIRRDNNVESHAAIKVVSIPSDESEVDSLRSEGLDVDGTRTYLKGIVDDFVGEIQLMESIKGIQNIVSVEDYKVVEKTDSIGWDIYIRMELLTPFNTFVCDKKLNERDVIKLGIDICTALEICGKRNIIHRDIKPENIFVNDFGDFKLGDFGIARKLENMTDGLSQKGTFNYMAPEVANSSTYDARADIYSLGIVLYRLLNSNRLPFLDTEKQLLNPNERKNAVERRIRGEELPAPCEASSEMANLILRACAYNPEMRFADATEMKKALIGVANGMYASIPATAVFDANTDYDATVAVRKAPQASGTPIKNNTNSKNDFYTEFDKKKSKAPKIVAIVLALVLLLSGAVVAYPYVSDSLFNDTANNDDPIQAIINDAEKLANNNYLDKAIEKIEQGLVNYPDSVDLQEKLDEYTLKLTQQEKQKILEDAAALAENGDYLGAMKKMETAHKAVPEDVDYEIAYYKYCGAYEDSVIAQADKLAENGDYNGAIALVEIAGKNITNSQKLDAAKNKYLQMIPFDYLHYMEYSEISYGGNTNNKFYLLFDGKASTPTETIYSEGLLFYRCGSYTEESPYIEYDLNGKYSALTGKLSMISFAEAMGTELHFKCDDLSRVIFYADGKEVYRTAWSNPTMELSFTVALNNAQKLRIEIESDNEYAKNCIALTGLELYKVGKTPALEETPAKNLIEIQHADFSFGGNRENKVYRIKGKATTPTGTVYNEGLLFYRCGSYTEESPYIEYDLNGKYSALTGKLSMIISAEIVKEKFDFKFEELSRVIFYADGKEVCRTAWSNPTMELSFTVALNNAQKLRIEIESDNDYAKNCIALTGVELS